MYSSRSHSYIIFTLHPSLKDRINPSLFLLFIYLFIYLLFLPALGLRCCTRAFSSCGEQGLLFVAVLGLLIAVLLLSQRTGSRGTGFSSCGLWVPEHRLSSCGAWAQLLCGMWDLPGAGIKPVSPALAGGFITTAPPGKSPPYFFYIRSIMHMSYRFDHVLQHTYLWR